MEFLGGIDRENERIAHAFFIREIHVDKRRGNDPPLLTTMQDELPAKGASP